MDKRRSLQVSEACWARLKQRALDERVTVREVAERAVHQYCEPSAVNGRGPLTGRTIATSGWSSLPSVSIPSPNQVAADLTYEDEK